MTRKTCYLIARILLFSWNSADAQSNKALAEAEKFYGIKAYESAFLKFQEAIQAGETDPMVHYKAGVCLFKSNDLSEQLKAIPYFEKALSKPQGLPGTLYYDLASLYQKNENLQKAIENAQKLGFTDGAVLSK